MPIYKPETKPAKNARLSAYKFKVSFKLLEGGVLV
jgi:hypothetical protein